MTTIDLRDLGGALIYLGYLAGALAAIGVVMRYVVLRWVVLPLKTWLREQIKPRLDDVHAEVTPNHGSSLKDAVTRIEQQQHELAQRLTDHLTNHPGRT
ncbi:hypothetical protein [Actinomadura sp. NPDC048394]|uniref:hypothetical protein n=1 Tax=Actinomadura sp. NPDC048394 TaxID=3158223 RepID=UPI0033ECA5FB